MNGKLSQEELSKTVDFCLNAFEHHAPEKHQAVLKKMETAVFNDGAQNPASLSVSSEKEAKIQEKGIVDPEGLSPDELKILNTIRARQMLRVQDTMSIKSFTSDAINGLTPLVERGNLGLRKAGAAPMPMTPMTDMSARVPTAIKVGA